MEEVKGIPTDEEIKEHFTTQSFHYRDGRNYKIKNNHIAGAKWMRDVLSKEIESRDAKIKELEKSLNHKVEIGKDYKSRGGFDAKVERWNPQFNMYDVKYSDGTIDIVNSKGQAVLRDNINPTDYDLILTL